LRRSIERTRQALGITVEDLVFDEPWLVVDLLVSTMHSLGKLPEDCRAIL